MKDIHIAIIGAGIGGMTAAVTLAQKGFKVNVFEQAPELSEVGAGLTVTPNATKGLIYLGLGQAMEKIGMAHDLQGVRHYQTKEMIAIFMKRILPNTSSWPTLHRTIHHTGFDRMLA